jgi:predicted RNA binding protein YcfA (HicA-like mRNA interferase family)
MAKDAISGYVASLRKPNDPVPTDDDTLVASLDLEYSPWKCPSGGKNWTRELQPLPVWTDFQHKAVSAKPTRTDGLPRFVLDHTSGSHFIFYHPTTRRRAVVSSHNRDLPKETLMSMLREAGFSREELLDFLKGR